MTQPNEELVQKAIITTDALAASGKLYPKQADKFIDYVIDETVLKDNARVVKFTNETLDIDKIGLGQRAAMPATEAVDPGLRRGVNTSKVSLTPKEIIVPFEIGDSFKEINIEGPNVEDHIIRMMARQLANDLEELYLNGDTLGPAISQFDYTGSGSTTDVVKDGLWALFNGWLRTADTGSSHVVDAENANIGSTLFSKMIRALPTKFRRNLKELRFFMSPDLLQLYAEKLASRGTNLGDIVIQNGIGTVPIWGINALGVPLMSLYPKVVEHVQLNGTTAVALRYKPIVQNPAEIVTPNTLAQTPTTPYLEGSGNDYNMDYANGTIARDAAGSIGDGDTVKVTYWVQPQALLTHMNNFIIGIGRDIRIEKDRDIFKRVNQYAITAKVSVNFEETDAIVKLINVGVG